MTVRRYNIDGTGERYVDPSGPLVEYRDVERFLPLAEDRHTKTEGPRVARFDPDVRDAIIEAELPTFMYRGPRAKEPKPILGTVSKCVLWTLWSLSHHPHVSVRAIAARVGCSHPTANLTISVLVEKGIVRKLGGYKSRQRYELVASRLRDFRSVEPLSLPPRGPFSKKKGL